MNKKLVMFFLSVTMMVNDSCSQETSDAHAEYKSEQIESTPSDQSILGSLNNEAVEHGYDKHTDENLKQIAEYEANTDLVSFPELLESSKPEMDQPKFESGPQASEEDAFGIEGIDTVELDQPQGNWLFKRIWWERSEARYEKIKKKIEEIFEHRMHFFEKRSELVKNILDPFYLKIGMGQGEFQAILEEYIQRLEAEREKKGSLSPQEREVLSRLDSEKEALEQLVIDVQAIGEVENRVDESLSRLLEQLGIIRRYDAQAWDAFKDIARVVDDEKARELYQVVDTALNNIKDIGYYIEHAFAAHFDQLIATAKEQTERVAMLVAGLKEKGIDLKKRVEQLTSQQSDVEKKLEKKAEKEEPEELGFFDSYIIRPLGSAWNGFISMLSWPYYVLFGQNEDTLEPEAE